MNKETAHLPARKARKDGQKGLWPEAGDTCNIIRLSNAAKRSDVADDQRELRRSGQAQDRAFLSNGFIHDLPRSAIERRHHQGT